MLSLHRLAGVGSRLNLLCLGAHPDDIEIGCGGTLLRLIDEVPEVKIDWIVFSAQGSRADEARRGADYFRGRTEGQVLVQDFQDGYFPAQFGQLKDFVEALKTELAPDLIFTHCRGDLHQDHRVVSELTWNTWRDHTILEYEVPKWDGDLASPNAFVPLSREVAERKVDGLMASFPSQSRKHWFSRETFLGLMRLRGNECRADELFAEAFYLRKMVLF